jgi:hypothetical protein
MFPDMQAGFCISMPWVFTSREYYKPLNGATGHLTSVEFIKKVDIVHIRKICWIMNDK